MSFQPPAEALLLSESDVEQKFIFPFITAERPVGLAYEAADVYTKVNLRKIKIGKGTEQKTYYPDYLIAQSSIPLVIIEAKAPGENLDAGFREARLYAAELNAQYPSGLNPVYGVIATDGIKLLAGFVDQATPKHNLKVSGFTSLSEDFERFASEFDVQALTKATALLLPRIRPRRFWKPRKMVGGVATQREEVGLNSFGATISTNFSHVFNPVTPEDRSFIAKNAYVSSKRRERYVDPIDRVIRASTPASEIKFKTIEDTQTPAEIVKTLRTKPLEHQVLLIVGSAGAGKTTFIDHLQEVAIPPDIRAKTVWLRIDMNPAPISRLEIYDWLRMEITVSCQTSEPAVDFEELETIKVVHAAEVNKFRKGIGRLYENDRILWNEKLGEALTKVLQDGHLMAQNHAKFCSTDKGKLLVIVLDNCDKRLRDEQLLMFEAAQWIQREFRGLVVLPLREETYDNHQNEPPLDTALKDLVFRIEPPLFQKILQARMALATQTIRSRQIQKFQLPNNMSVSYPEADQAHFLSSIMRSIFEHDMHVRRLIVGLSGRNMRRAMEIFLDFCTSGHIGEDFILKMVQSKGQYVLPLSVVTNVLLRSNLRFYDSDRAYLKNVYSASEFDERPAFLARLIMLRWLDERSNAFGPKRLKGYEQVGKMRHEMAKYGVVAEVFSREIENLARGFCILSEDFRVEGLSDEDLVALSPAGRVHLQMSSNVYYLAAIAEDSWFIAYDEANAIAERVKNPAQHHQPRTIFYDARAVLRSLDQFRRQEIASYDAVFDDGRLAILADIRRAQNEIDMFERSIVAPEWLDVPTRFPRGSEHIGRVAGVTTYGLFVDLAPRLSGLVHTSGVSGPKFDKSEFRVGQLVVVRVINVDHTRKRVELSLDREAQKQTSALKN